ncbi:cobalamin-binding domain protein [Salipaludibacillus keqinensis]|uniref:Cobalamin-binding domain protein n=1 Tax=Salipaludibacillus keqinensis TaxID=2045207 RepID=A0A323TJE4_9BACI|nr:B12-binding domain-containing protein [Salipaludibacillus keqinensis]PYZ95232.1 cobalamin-binding domain protein [Salipaludibacillus keqinensis]
MQKTTETFVDALLKGDHAASLRIVQNQREHHSRFTIYNELITPAMHEIGMLWQQNKITVADEHLATAVCDFVLSQTEYDLVQHSDFQETTPKAMFFTVQDEYHYLGLKMVSILFREKDWNVKYYQSNLSIDHVMEQVETWKPAVIGLSFALAYRIEALTAYLKKFSELDYEPEILVGGRLMHQYDFSSIGPPNTTFIENLNELQTWFNKDKTIRRDDSDGKANTSSVI